MVNSPSNACHFEPLAGGEKFLHGGVERMNEWIDPCRDDGLLFSSPLLSPRGDVGAVVCPHTP